LGEALRSLVRVYDVAGRYGGEEFIIIALQLSEEAACEYANRIRVALGDRVVQAGPESISVNVSIGVAHAASPPQCPPDDMVRAADNALYAAKDRGRNCVVLQAVPCIARAD
jgi:two-component system, cell cycle response regulator